MAIKSIEFFKKGEQAIPLSAKADSILAQYNMKDFLYRSEKIREFRAKKGVTQVEFAKKIGVSKGYIAQIETGTRKVNIKFLDKLQAAFNIPEDQILEIIYGNPAASKEFIARIENIEQERKMIERLEV